MTEPLDLNTLTRAIDGDPYTTLSRKEARDLIAELRATRAERDEEATAHEHTAVRAATSDAWRARAERAEAERDAARRAADDREQARLLQELRAEEFKAAIARVEALIDDMGPCPYAVVHPSHCACKWRAALRGDHA